MTLFSSLDDIDVIHPQKKLGDGVFSKVYKVVIKKTGELAAMKEVS